MTFRYCVARLTPFSAVSAGSATVSYSGEDDLALEHFLIARIGAEGSHRCFRFIEHLVVTGKILGEEGLVDLINFHRPPFYADLVLNAKVK